MDIIKKFNELKINIKKNTDLVYNQEMSTFCNLLSVNDTSLINIHNKNDIIADYEFKKEVLNLLMIFIENNLLIKDKSLINIIADLVIKDIPDINVDFCLQLEEIIKKIWKTCCTILFYCGDIEDLPQIKDFIFQQDIPDLRNICLSLIFYCDNFKSYDLENLSHFSSFSVLYDVIKIYKDELPEEIKAKVLINLYQILTKETYTIKDKYSLSKNLLVDSNIKLTEKTVKFAYLIFYEINFLSFPRLMKQPSDGTFSNEYMMLIYSLIIDEDSSLTIFKILQSNDVYPDLYNGINSLIINKKKQYQEVDPRDEKYLFFILEVVVKMLYMCNNKMIKITFMMFIDPLMKYSLYDNQNNDVIYDYLSYYCEDMETYVNISEFYKSKKKFDRENIFNNNFSSSLLRFLWFINQELAIELALYSLKSENKEVVKTCFNIFEKTDLDISSNLLLNANHIRRAIIKNENLINILINYQINKKMVINDILLINVIMGVENYKFFEYASLFKDFGKYMNDKFLERLIDNIEEGLIFLETNITHSTVKFIKSNEKWFNLFLSNNKIYYPLIFKIYEKMLEIDKNIEFSFEEGFLLLEVPNSSVFRILSHKIMQNVSFIEKKMISSKYITNKEYEFKNNTNKEYEFKDDTLKDYILYLKTRAITGDNIESLIKFLKTDYFSTNNILVDDIIGFYKLITGKNLDIKSESVLCTYDNKDTKFFIRNFNKVSDFEKSFLFIKIEDKIDLQDEYKLLKIIKDVVTNSFYNKMLYRQCLTLLLRLNNIDGIVRLVEDFEDKDLLLKINIRNIVTGGMYFNPRCVNVGSKDLQVKACFILYFKNLWSVSALRSWISGLSQTCKEDEDFRYLVDDINKKHEIEIY